MLSSFEVFREKDQSRGGFVKSVGDVNHLFLEPCSHKGEKVHGGNGTTLHGKSCSFINNRNILIVKDHHRIESFPG